MMRLSHVEFHQLACCVYERDFCLRDPARIKPRAFKNQTTRSPFPYNLGPSSNLGEGSLRDFEDLLPVAQASGLGIKLLGIAQWFHFETSQGSFDSEQCLFRIG